MLILDGLSRSPGGIWPLVCSPFKSTCFGWDSPSQRAQSRTQISMSRIRPEIKSKTVESSSLQAAGSEMPDSDLMPKKGDRDDL